MTNSGRSSRLALLRVSEYVAERNNRLQLPAVIEVDVASGIYARSQVAEASGQDAWSRVDSAVSLMGIEEFDFILRIGGDVGKNELVRIPYGLLREAWVTMDGKMALFLEVRVVRRGTRVTLEPFWGSNGSSVVLKFSAWTGASESFPIPRSVTGSRPSRARVCS